MTHVPLAPRAPLSVVTPTLNSASRLPACLGALTPGAIEGLVKDVVVSDGGSDDETIRIAESFGAQIIKGEPGRGGQLQGGADAARGAWLLFLHSDTVLSGDWIDAARDLMSVGEEAVGVFQLRFDAPGVLPSAVAWGANVRTRLFSAPYGDQGLLISRALYDEVGGYRALPLFEDVDMIDRIIAAKGRRAVRLLKADAITSAERYTASGYAPRIAKNMVCMALYRLGRPPSEILSYYNAS
ncbi:MAG: TIGR04283 family arsenosugar biosynthesis glycosyltransferase [Pseudomonadota bacterium]